MFSNVDVIRAANAFGGRGQWRTGLHYLSNQYEPQQNNFGMTVTEPFGDHERLGFSGPAICRCGLWQVSPARWLM